MNTGLTARFQWHGLITMSIGMLVLTACVTSSSTSTSSLQPQVNQVAAPPSEPTPAPTQTPTNAVNVPGSIDATGSRDVSSELQSFIDKAPNGSTIVFKAGGTYRLGKGLVVSGRRDLTLDGNGARLDLPTTDQGFSSIGIQVRDSTGTTVRGFTMVGNNSEAGTSAACCDRENNHAIAVLSADDTLIEDLDIRRVWGDCFYVNGTSAAGRPWSDGVTFRDSTCRLTGRHGVGIIRASNVRVVNNVFDEIGFMVVDIEPGASDAGAIGVVVRGNDIGSYGLTSKYDSWLLAACGADGAVVQDVTVTGNSIEGNRVGRVGSDGERKFKALHIKICGDDGPRENYTVTDNVAQATVEGPASYFFDVKGVTFTGNEQPLSKGEQASFPGSTNVTYDG